MLTLQLWRVYRHGESSTYFSAHMTSIAFMVSIGLNASLAWQVFRRFGPSSYVAYPSSILMHTLGLVDGLTLSITCPVLVWVMEKPLKEDGQSCLLLSAPYERWVPGFGKIPSICIPLTITFKRCFALVRNVISDTFNYRISIQPSN